LVCSRDRSIGDDAFFEIDIFPTERKRFAAPGASAEKEGHDRAQRATLELEAAIIDGLTAEGVPHEQAEWIRFEWKRRAVNAVRQ